jgi:hypothetical protein
MQCTFPIKLKCITHCAARYFTNSGTERKQTNGHFGHFLSVFMYVDQINNVQGDHMFGDDLQLTFLLSGLGYQSYFGYDVPLLVDYIKDS